ncbi:pentapeptide repeat-containing protein [Leptolyngbya sp. FACHB-711]|uniref:pentapeptide repeat-containing protein n=1 Tax=unclassified Leptolyngbya TaxID=2650499 RepID=UPI0018EFAC73|nr:pentapeptide repeat-containing protein [Leptolyngbya sp. FACHB-711]
MFKIVSSMLETRLSSGFLRIKGLKVVTSFLALLLLTWLLLTLFYPPKSKPGSPLSPELKELDESLKIARETTDPFIREDFIQREAKRFGKTTDDYKKLMSIRKRDGDILPNAPYGDSLGDWVRWYFDELIPEQRLSVAWGTGLWGIGKVATFAIVFAVLLFLLESPKRSRQAKYQAWQVVYAAYGQKVSGARIAALEDLRARGESLSSLTLEKEAVLSEINLTDADLTDANLSHTDLSDAILCGARLIGANLSGAILIDADLSRTNLSDAILCNARLSSAILCDAILCGATLSHAILSRADLCCADLCYTDLSGTDLNGAIFCDAILSHAILNDADLSSADLSGVDLSGTDLSGANLSGVNFQEAILLALNLSKSKELSRDQLTGLNPPLLCAANLPDGMKDLSNRDCDRLPQVLMDRYPDNFKTLDEAREYMKNVQNLK